MVRYLQGLIGLLQLVLGVHAVKVPVEVVVEADGSLEVHEQSGVAQPAAWSGAGLRVVSWNVAGINNNPFEYWKTVPTITAHNDLMMAAERFILNPGAEDVKMNTIITEERFQQLVGLIRTQMSPSEPEKRVAFETQLSFVKQTWASDYSMRKVVSEFWNDTTFGDKRLSSMPDRVTNTIKTKDGTEKYRPTVINCYEGDIGSVGLWWESWLNFVFETKVDLGKGEMNIYNLFESIEKAKYPAILDAEAAASIPLQIVVLAMFDAVLVQFMVLHGGSRDGGPGWQTLRTSICESFVKQKPHHVVEILNKAYHEADIFFLQEIGKRVVDELRTSFDSTHHVLLGTGTKGFDDKKDQNSVILVRRSLVSEGPEEHHVTVEGAGKGDLVVFTATVANAPMMLASFHGDTNGLKTIPMLTNVTAGLEDRVLLIGMDANTYKENNRKGYQGAEEFANKYKNLGLESSSGTLDVTRHTTWHARTYLQAQLNKAVKSDALGTSPKTDKDPKDWILFTKSHWTSLGAWRDNTGKGPLPGAWEDDVMFPTLTFPSDHAVISALLHE